MTVWDFIPVVCKYYWPKMKCYLNGNCPDIQCLTLLTWWLAKIIQLWLPSHSFLSMLEWHVMVSHSVMDICIYMYADILRIRYLCLARDLSRHSFTVSVLIKLVSLQITRKTDLWKILKTESYFSSALRIASLESSVQLCTWFNVTTSLLLPFGKRSAL